MANKKNIVENKNNPKTFLKPKKERKAVFVPMLRNERRKQKKRKQRARITEENLIIRREKARKLCKNEK